MKKILSIVLSVCLCLTFVVVLTGCATKYDTKTTIVIEPYGAAGYGLAWLDKLATEWTEANKDLGFNIIVKKSSNNLAGTHLSQIAAGSTDTDIYIASTTDYQQGFYRDYFEDLSDLLNVKPDGDGGLTIKEKINDYDSWKQLSSKWVYDATANSYSLEGCYMLPHSKTLTGMVYDHDDFAEKGLLTYAENSDEVKAALTEQGITYSVNGGKLVFVSSATYTNYTKGDYILSAGKDGKYGTYDDGQPQTLAEFDTMINKIKGIGVPFIAQNQDASYITYITDAYFTQYAGMDAYSAVVSYDSNGKAIALADGTTATIDMSNGYLANNAKGIAEAINFTAKYFNKGNSTVCSYQATVDAMQREFVTGGTGDAKATFYGMAIDGNWFEMEAASTMNTANKYSDKPRGYGEVDYRFMLLPTIDGQLGIDGEGNGSVMAGIENGGMLVRKQSDDKKLAAIKSFIAYTLTNDALSDTTASCGLVRNYKYTMTDNQLASMTPFQRTCYSIFTDTDNVKVLTARADRGRNPICWSGATKLETLFTINGQTPIEAILSGSTVENCIAGVKNMFSANSWASAVTTMNNTLPKK